MTDGGETASPPTEEQLRSGVTFRVRYVGSMEIHTSMKSLSFEKRTMIAKECIIRVCEAANVISFRERPQKNVDMMDHGPNLEMAGEDVDLTVSIGSLNVSLASAINNNNNNNQTLVGGAAFSNSVRPMPPFQTSTITLFHHPMPSISFASGGDEDTSEFVCYVGKSEELGRQCLVFECGVSIAAQLLEAIGLAFKYRFDETQRGSSAAPGPKHVSSSSTSSSGVVPTSHQPAINSFSSNNSFFSTEPNTQLPSASPHNTDIQPSPSHSFSFTNPTGPNGASGRFGSSNTPTTSASPSHLHTQHQRSSPTHAMSSPLSQNMPQLASTDTLLAQTDAQRVVACPDPMLQRQERVRNFSSGWTRVYHPDQATARFSDMKRKNASFEAGSGMEEVSRIRTIRQKEQEMTSQEVSLSREIWYHGAIPRQQAEQLLKRDGDFLVRMSGQGHGQYVLTGLQSSVPKHLLLIDNEGKVRTRDREFQSVPHLIQYHRDNNLPITSAESALLLKYPISRQQALLSHKSPQNTAQNHHQTVGGSPSSFLQQQQPPPLHL